jgi:CHAT domain-containing protein
MAALPDDKTALLEFVASPNAPVTVFIIQRGKVDARVLGPADSIEQNITRFRALIESGADAGKVARALGAALIDPLGDALDKRVTRLVVVPDGGLHRLPFDALRLADGKYLVERYAVGFAPSASVVEALWARRATEPAPTPVRMLALADPTVPGAARGTDRDANAAVFYAAAQAAGGLTRLKGAAREARLVARYAPSADVRVGREATAAFLKQTDLRRYDVLHFATHAIVDEKSVAGTALALAPTPGESGFVGAGDLAALKINADLVVLSACSSAGGVINANEGVQGLTSALLQAGARSLVATGWRIRDQDVVPLVDGFYSALSRGMPVIDALRDAKLRELRSGSPVRIWGAFIAVGDPLVTLQLKQPEAWWRKYTAKN